MSGTVRYAGGDFNADGRADLVAVNGTSMRRYLGNSSGNGTFTGQTTVTATPGPAGGLPAIAGTTVGIANTRLRLYDHRCTIKSTGFPANETFVAGGLCDSVVLPGTTNASHIVPVTVGARHFFLIVTGATAAVYEAVFAPVFQFRSVSAVLRSSTPLSGIRDVVWSPVDQLFLFAVGNNTVQARRLTTGSGTATLTTIPALGSFTANTSEITHITLGEFVADERSIVVSDAKTETITVVPFTIAGGWRPQDLVVASYDINEDTQRAGDLAVGQFNDDTLLDVAVLDAETGNVIIVRQQPAPCMSFITSPSQGMIIFPSGSYEPIAAFNRRLPTEVALANAARRPATGFRDLAGPDNAALCPARFIDVRGHWEKLSGEGDVLIGISRGAWVGSDWFIWVPKPLNFLGLPNPPSSPGIVQPWYWAAALTYLPAVAVGDFNALGRLTLGGVGFATEHIGRGFTSEAGIKASRLLNETLRTAISDADGSMDKCTGTIFVDLLGHSRGGPMITQALRRGFEARGNYNFEVSTTILDAPDPSGDDNWRPWVKGGFIVGDPVITRVGSEWNSSFYSKDTSGEFWIIEDIPQFFENQWIRFLDVIIPAPVTAVFPNVEYIRTEIIGLPIGRDRQAELELSERSFGAYQGPLGNIRHKDVLAGDAKLDIENGMLWVDPENDARNNLRQPHPDLTNASEFAFTSSTHLGLLLTDPRGFDASSAVGFRTSTNFADEAGCLAAGTNNECGVPGTCGQQVTAAAGAASEARAFDGLVVRELVPDFDFRVAGGVAENARILDGPGMPNLKALMPDDFAPLREFLTETAVTGWVESGTWERTGAVTLGGTYAPMVDNVKPFIGASTTASALEAELEALTNADMQDRVAAFSAAAAHLTGSGDSWVDIGGSGGNVKANLLAASLVAQQLLVRVEYDLGTATNAQVKVALKGPGVSTSASWTSSAGTTRQVAELVVNRSGVFSTGTDRITVAGTDVRVYAVSVRPAPPMQVSGSDSHFELVLLDAGTSPQRATALASRSMYQGKKGRLARFTSTTVLNKLEADVRAWVDGSSATGAAGSFTFAKEGGMVPDSLWSPTTSFTVPRPRGAQAYTLPGKGLRLDHGHPSTSVAAQRVGFWVEYPETSSFARFVTEVSAMFASDDASEGDDEVVIEAAGEPGCVSLVGLECFEDASPLD